MKIRPLENSAMICHQKNSLTLSNKWSPYLRTTNKMISPKISLIKHTTIRMAFLNSLDINKQQTKNSLSFFNWIYNILMKNKQEKQLLIVICFSILKTKKLKMSTTLNFQEEFARHLLKKGFREKIWTKAVLKLKISMNKSYYNFKIMTIYFRLETTTFNLYYEWYQYKSYNHNSTIILSNIDM